MNALDITSRGSLKVYITTRPYPVTSLKTGHAVNVEQENHADISRYVNDLLKGVTLRPQVTKLYGKIS